MSFSSFKAQPRRAKVTSADLRQLVYDTFQEHKYNPIKEMIELATTPATPIEIRAALHRELATYVVPKVKATEPDGSEGGDRGGVNKVQIVKFGEDDVSRLQGLDPSKGVDQLLLESSSKERFEAQVTVLEEGIEEPGPVIDGEASEVKADEPADK